MHLYRGRESWESLATKKRCRIIAGVASRITDAAEELTQLCTSDQRTDAVETVAAELLPLCSGLRFIGRKAPRILRDRKCGMIGRPAWLWGVSSIVRRDPHGKVLLLGTWNYPLLLVGIQAAQALAAGNSVLIKPAVGCETVTRRLVTAFHDAGVPGSVLQQLDSSTESAVAAIEQGVDLIVLTGSVATGRKVLRQAAERVTPSIMELSGCDAVVVMPGSDRDRVARAINFGLNFNAGATCIGPRRLIVESAMADRLITEIRQQLEAIPPHTIHPAARQNTSEAIDRAIDQGAVDVMGSYDAEQMNRSGKMRPLVLDHIKPEDSIAAADLFAPLVSIIRVDEIKASIKIINDCPYRLAASVFGPAREASQLASQLRVGSVSINDLLVPTADPRVPFGGRGISGFGVTRGAEGLLAMTVPAVISRRRGRFAPHLQPQPEGGEQALLGALHLLHAGTLRDRIKGLRQMMAAHGQSNQSKPLADDRLPPDDSLPPTEKHNDLI